MGPNHALVARFAGSLMGIGPLSVVLAAGALFTAPMLETRPGRDAAPIDAEAGR